MSLLFLQLTNKKSQHHYFYALPITIFSITHLAMPYISENHITSLYFILYDYRRRNPRKDSPIHQFFTPHRNHLIINISHMEIVKIPTLVSLQELALRGR